LAEVSKCFVIELLSIIRDEDSRDAEATNDAFLEKVLDILLSDNGQRFCHGPFSEIVDPYNEELKLPHCYEEGSHYVKPPLSEWPGSVHWCKMFRQLSYDVVEALSFVTRLCVGLGVLMHSGPLIPSSYEFMDQRACSQMVATYFLMDFPHDIACFVEDQASQV